jgi:hypothetical protein
VGDEIQRGKFLEDADRVSRTENSHGTGKANVSCASGGRTQNDDRGRIYKLAAVVFADAEDIETNLVGEHNLFE